MVTVKLSPLGLKEIEAPRIFGQWSYDGAKVCQLYSPAAFSPQEVPPVPVSELTPGTQCGRND